MGMTIKATLLTSKMMQALCLLISGIFCMRLMDLFVFPLHVQQVFFWSELKTPQWKVVLHREAQNRRIMANTIDDFIDTRKVVSGLATPMEFAKLENDRTLVGAIKLNRE